jgi:hypothetical protein
MQRRTKPGQVLPFPKPPSIGSDEQLRSLSKIFELLGEIRDDLDALEAEWSDRWHARVRKLRAETARERKVQVMRS